VTFYERECRILCQSENGPCPLLAIMNLLLLRGKLSLSASAISTGAATVEEVVTSLATMLLDVAAPSEAMRSNHEQNVADAVDCLANLQVGLDVNIRFTGCTDMEYTKELIVFDLLGIEMLHGWLLDPQDRETAAAIGKTTYNQLMERLIESKTAEAPQRPQPQHGNATEGSEQAAAEEVAAEESNGEASAPAAEGPEEVLADEKLAEAEEEFEEMERTHSELIRDGALIDDFLAETSTQLTYFGLAELHREIKEGQGVVFFRNNHYSVLHKYRGQLYNLVTDVGYCREVDIVWERLDEVEGDSDFYSGQFNKFVPHAQRPAQRPPEGTVVTGSPVVNGTAVAVRGTPVDAQCDADAALAQRLHQEELQQEQRARAAHEQKLRADQAAQQRAQKARADQAAQRRAQQQAILAARKKEAEEKKKKDSCALM